MPKRTYTTPHREKRLGPVQVTADELRAVQRSAKLAGLSVAAYVRAMCLPIERERPVGQE